MRNKTKNKWNNIEIQIDKDIPIHKRRSGSQWDNIFNQMDIGDSFLVPNDILDHYKSRESMHSILRKAAICLGMKIALRAEDNSYRVWRTE